MNEQEATVEAWIAEYRADADKMDAHELPQPTTQYLRILLDRIEAARERERARLMTEPRSWEECIKRAKECWDDVY